MTRQEHEILNRLWNDKECWQCHRQYPETLLNIEGFLHHNLANFECLNVSNCVNYCHQNKIKRNAGKKKVD